MNRISFQNVYQTITQRGEFKLGQRASTPDGREWRFVTSTTLANGNIAIPAAVASSDLYSSSTDSQGRIVYATRAANSLTVGAFEDAIGVVDDGTGVGRVHEGLPDVERLISTAPDIAAVRTTVAPTKALSCTFGRAVPEVNTGCSVKVATPVKVDAPVTAKVLSKVAAF